MVAAKRDPDGTRQKLLEAAFEEIHRHGFRSASLDNILAGTGVTKGAMYHHFANKLELGYAVVDEVIGGPLAESWLGPIRASGNPIDQLQELARQSAANATHERMALGCPLFNLAQEMSPIDEGFRQRINAIFDTWRGGFAQALERGQADGHVRPDLEPAKIATFLVSAIEGTIGLAKNSQSVSLMRANLECYIDYLEGLRARPGASSETAKAAEAAEAAA